MAFDFPSAPTVGDIHTEAGVEYQYEGNSVWNLVGGGTMTDYVLKAGDTMTGTLNGTNILVVDTGFGVDVADGRCGRKIKSHGAAPTNRVRMLRCYWSTRPSPP